MNEVSSPAESADEPILQCPTCRSQLSLNSEVSELDENCPSCRAKINLHVFPRLYREPVEKSVPRLSDGTEAKCNFYPELAAEKVCDECGCFLSEKASVRWGNLDLCLPCLHRLREEKKSTSFVARSRLHDNRALALVTLLAPLTLFTAPIAVFILLKNRKNPSSFAPRGKVRWWIAMILAILWIAVWTVLLVVWSSLILEDFA
jgi:hypothetical protein